MPASAQVHRGHPTDGLASEGAREGWALSADLLDGSHDSVCRAGFVLPRGVWPVTEIVRHGLHVVVDIDAHVRGGF